MSNEDREGIRTRGQRQQELDRRRFEDSSLESEEQPRATDEETTEPHPGTSGASALTTTPDLGALMLFIQEQSRMLQEQLQRDKEEQARRQEEQARRQEEQARRQEEQARRQEEQSRLLQEQLQRDKDEQARRLEEQTFLLKDLHATFSKDLNIVKEQVLQHEDRFQQHDEQLHQHENQFAKTEAQITKINETIKELKSGNGTSVATAMTASTRDFKVPPYDGTSSWSAYKRQFEAVMKANGWTKEQAMTALTLGLRDQALTILEVLGEDATYDQLVEALESRYGETHLEHVFRAQLRDRVQRSNENLQQWAHDVEKLVRKAYQSTPALVEGILLQTFVDGLRDIEVRAAVRLGHHKTMKDALAHALEVEAVRQDHRAHRIREVAESPVRDRRQGYSPRCYNCGEKGHFQIRCPKRNRSMNNQAQEERVVGSDHQQQGNE